MNFIVLTENMEIGRNIQYTLEDMEESWRCIPLTQAEQALSLLPSGMDVLLLFPCPESAALLQSIRTHPPLVPPYLFGMGMDAPDGNLSALDTLPEVLRRCRTTGQLPALSMHHLSITMEIASALLHAMEMPQRLRAWAFLPEMLALTVVHPPLLQDLHHGLYPLIARRHGMTPAGVERSLRLCVESTWSHGSLDALERFFGSSVDPERGKPTNREFLCRLQERLTLTMQRLV